MPSNSSDWPELNSEQLVEKAIEASVTRPGDITRWDKANFYMLRALFVQQEEQMEAFHDRVSLRKSARASGANTPSPAPREPRAKTVRPPRGHSDDGYERVNLPGDYTEPPTPEQTVDYHTYDPNFQAGGDCNVCGHGFDFWAHLSYPMGHKPSHSNGEAPGVSWCTEHERFEVE